MRHGDHRGDGDGWVQCAHGHRHWGRFGAAGLLVHRRTDAGATEVLLQHRAEWSHHGGTWGLLGGARQRAETAVRAALREAGEEGDLDPRAVRVHGAYDDEHGGWSYTTVLAGASGPLDAQPTGLESIDVQWWQAGEVVGLPLHPGFARSWPVLSQAMSPLRIVVDTTVATEASRGGRDGSGGGVGRLAAGCALLSERGIADGALPAELARPPLHRWWPRVDLMTRAELAAELPGAEGEPVLVVTAGGGLRARWAAAGAVAVEPSWLHRLLEEPARPG